MIFYSPVDDHYAVSFNQEILIKMPFRFTVLEADSFQQQFQKICQNSSAYKKIVLDFSQTTFMDSNGLIALCRMVHQARSSRVNLGFSSFSAQVQMILSLAGLDEVFKVEDDTEAIEKVDYQKAGRHMTIHPSVMSKTKRLIDILGALVGLGITTILFIPLAIAIKLDSPGPILFSQIRCGYKGRRFRIWKFRSMLVNASLVKDQVQNQVQGPFFKNENDPRITKVGRFIRKTSWDEFPQFLNVLKGDMSLVGTRPPTPDEVEQYEVHHRQRLDVKPGLTGEWQVKGRSKIVDFEEVLRLDLQYQKRWSLFYDLQLIFKTIGVILSKKSGAC